MRRDTTADRRWLWDLVPVGLVVCLLLLTYATMSCTPEARADLSPYALGDTVRYSFTFPDSNGVGTIPTSARMFVLARGAVIDSSQTQVGGDIDTLSVGSTAVMAGSYVVPAAVGSAPVDLELWVRASGDGFVNDWLRPSPAVVRINPAYDLTTIATAGFAVVDSSSCTPCGVYLSGSNAGGTVWVTNSTPFTSMTQVVGLAYAVTGYWRTVVKQVPGVDDTLYVWRQPYGSNLLSSGTQLILTE